MADLVEVLDADKRDSDGQIISYGSNTCSCLSPLNLPSCTSSWTEEIVYNFLNVEATLECTPNDVFSTGLIDLLKGEKLYVKNEMRKYFPPSKSDDLHLKIQKECFEFAFNNFIDINCDSIENVDAVKVFRFMKELGKMTLKDSSFGKWLDSPLSAHVSSSFEESKGIREVICQKMFERLKMFYDQLLCMMNYRKRMDLTEMMFQDLFLAFVRVFDLTVINNLNLQPFKVQCGKKTVISEPDAIICKYFPADVFSFTEKVIAVIEVKKEYSRDASSQTKKRKRSGEKISDSIGHINSGLKGQLTGEMIAALPSSVFGLKGVYGFIVQGTKVTVASLRVGEEFMEQLKNGRVKNSHAFVRYSPECNLLTKDGRSQLIDIFLGMKKLLECLEI